MISCTAGLFAQSEFQYAQVVNNLGWVNPSYYGMSRDITGTFVYANRLDGQLTSEGFDIPFIEYTSYTFVSDIKEFHTNE